MTVRLRDSVLSSDCVRLAAFWAVCGGVSATVVAGVPSSTRLLMDPRRAVSNAIHRQIRQVPHALNPSRNSRAVSRLFRDCQTPAEAACALSQLILFITYISPASSPRSP